MRASRRPNFICPGGPSPFPQHKENESPAKEARGTGARGARGERSGPKWVGPETKLKWRRESIADAKDGGLAMLEATRAFHRRCSCPPSSPPHTLQALSSRFLPGHFDPSPPLPRSAGAQFHRAHTVRSGVERHEMAWGAVGRALRRRLLEFFGTPAGTAIG